MWALGKLNHVAIAVPDLQAATAMYRDMLGADVSGEQVIFKCVLIFLYGTSSYTLRNGRFSSLHIEK